MPRLLTVSGGHIELEANKQFVLGRALDADIVVQDMSCSRRHAQLTLGALNESCFLVDLDSRNGTYVNEQRVTDRTSLGHGTRIRIGATVYLLSLHESEEEAESNLHDTGTVALDEWTPIGTSHEKLQRLVNSLGTLSTEFAGQISRHTLIEVLQLLMQTHRSGTLHVVTEGGPAEIDVRLGEIHSAHYGQHEEFDALVELAQQKTGIFWLETSTEPCHKAIRQPTANLLIELCRTMDEATI